MTSRTVLLTPLPEHLPFLHGLALDAHARWPWVDSARSFSEFQESLKVGVFENYVISSRRSLDPMGYMALHDANFFHGYVSLSLYLASAYQKVGYPFEAVALLLGRVFGFTPLRHVYAEVTDDVAQAVGLARCGATLVTFPGKLMLGGVPADQVVLSLSRLQWEAIAHRFHLIPEGAESVGGQADESPAPKRRVE